MSYFSGLLLYPFSREGWFHIVFAVICLGDGRKDALFFVLGGLVGAYLYVLTCAHLQGIFLLKKLPGENVTLAQMPDPSNPVLR